MATAAISLRINECPVCMERLLDPRILECAHHFCRVCLEEIAERHPQGHVTCPTCRHVTKTTGPKDISNLHRFRIASTFEEDVNHFEVATKAENIEKICGLCNDRNPKNACLECQIDYCQICREDHKALEKQSIGHKLYPISNFIYCKPHSSHATLYCNKCRVVCCLKCSMAAHKLHDLCKVGDAMQSTVKQLKDNLSEVKVSNKEETALANASEIIQKITSDKLKVNSDFDKLEQSLQKLMADLKKTRKEMNGKMDAELKSLSMMKEELESFTESKAKLKGHIEYLLTKASPHEMIARSPDLPRYNSDKDVIQSLTLQHPSLDVPLKTLNDNIIDVCDKLKVKNTEIIAGGRSPGEPITNVNFVKTFNTYQSGGAVWGVVADTEQKELVVRRQDQQEPITIFDYDGNKKRTLGTVIAGIAAIPYQRIDIDTKRGLYVLPVSGDIMLVDKQGNKTGQLKVSDKNIHGICYDKHKDVYITSSHGGLGGDNKVYIINASDRTVISSFLSVTSCGVASGYQTVNGQTKHVITVTGNDKSCVKVYDFQGNVLYTAGVEGKSGSTDGYLHYPYGVCIDPSGRILVGDQGNKRVVSGDDKSWEQLLSVTHNALHVTFDPTKRRLFVGSNPGPVSVFSY